MSVPPPQQNQDEHKEAFYQQLNEVIRRVPAGDKLIIFGDFNARIVSNHTEWAHIIGQRGICHENSNDNLLILLYSQYNLLIINTFFQPNISLKQTNKKHITPGCIQDRSTGIKDLSSAKNELRDFHITRSMRVAECSTDHLLLRSKVNIQVPRKRRPQDKKQKRILRNQ